AGGARRRRAALTGLRVVGLVRGRVRGARRRLRGRGAAVDSGARRDRRGGDSLMAFIEGAIPWRRPAEGRSGLVPRVRARIFAPTTTLSWAIVALVVALNLIGLVMILSASSVQARTNYGSA